MRKAVILRSDGAIIDVDLDSNGEGVHEVLDVMRGAVNGDIEYLHLSDWFGVYVNAEHAFPEHNFPVNQIATKVAEWAGLPETIRGDVLFTGGITDAGDVRGLTDHERQALFKYLGQSKAALG